MNIRLVDLDKNDLEWLTGLYMCPMTQKYILGPLSEVDAHKKAENLLFKEGHALERRKLVTDKSTPLGYIVLFTSREFPEEIEIGFVVDPNHVGQGYGSLMLSLLLQEVSQKHKGRTFIALVDNNNMSSQGILKKNGFQFSDTFKSELYPDECCYLELQR